ncbi:probable disease resistance protein At5g45490 [Fagus crenata]
MTQRNKQADISSSSKTKGQTTDRWSSWSVDANQVHGFDTELIYLEKMLQQRQSVDEFKAVGIVGKRGVGKTTLCQVLFNKPEIQAKFLPRIWVCLSSKPNEKKDQKEETVSRMLICLGVDDNIIDSVLKNHGLGGLLYALHLQLTGKKYLIVLDDATAKDEVTKKWYEKLNSPITESEKWGERLAFGLPKGNGGTVIVTSRDEKLAKAMVEEKNLHRLLPLSDPSSCWSIFNESIVKRGEKLEGVMESEEIKKEFLRKSSGLPLAAKMMGQIRAEEEAEQRQRKKAEEEAEQRKKAEGEAEQRKKAEEEAEQRKKAEGEAEQRKKAEEEAEQRKKAEGDAAKGSSITSKDDEQDKSQDHPTGSEPKKPQEEATTSSISHAGARTQKNLNRKPQQVPLVVQEQNPKNLKRKPRQVPLVPQNQNPKNLNMKLQQVPLVPQE